MGGRATDLGYLTTPQAHYLVYKANLRATLQAGPEDYYADFSANYNKFVGLLGPTDYAAESLYVDCADGVGGRQLPDMAKRLPFDMKIFNTSLNEPVHLNDCCGAEYVQKERKLPRNFASVPIGAKCASFDGDADRIVYL